MVEGAANNDGPGLTAERVCCPDRVAEVPRGTAASSAVRYNHITVVMSDGVLGPRAVARHAPEGRRGASSTGASGTDLAGSNKVSVNDSKRRHDACRLRFPRRQLLASALQLHWHILIGEVFTSQVFHGVYSRSLLENNMDMLRMERSWAGIVTEMCRQQVELKNGCNGYPNGYHVLSHGLAITSKA